jgi:hypothetical protein
MSISSDMHRSRGDVDVKELARTFFHELGHGTNDSMAAAIVDHDGSLMETAADFWGMTEGMRLGDIPQGTLVRDYRDQGASWTERRANSVERKLKRARAARAGH